MTQLECTRERCLDAGELADFVHGALSSHEAAAIERHVARCPACRTLLSLVARSDSSAPLAWAASLSTLGPVPGAPATAASALVEGTRVGRYVLRDRLGAGAMGVVFTAHDPELDRAIAIKLLRSDLGAAAPRLPLTARLLREAQAMAQLAHPNVVAVHDVGWFGDHVFLAMELVQGQTLAQWLAAARRSASEVLAMFIAAGNGLAAAHAAGLVHRDFKPENVLVGRDGRVRVGDFGLAARAAPPDAALPDGARGGLGQLAGTPFYMAPEQLAGEPVDARTDQYGFCVAIYAALTGKHPLRRDGVRAARPPRDGLPAWLWHTLRRGLAADRALRYPSMDELLAQLARGPDRRRRSWLAAAAAAAIVACGGGLTTAHLGAPESAAWATGDAAASDAGTRRGRAEAALPPAEALAIDGDGRTSYFTTDADGVLWEVRQRASGGAADRTRVVDGAVGSPVIVLDDHRRLQLMIRRVEATLWHAWQGPDGAWQSEQVATGATDDAAVAVAARRLVGSGADSCLW